MQNYPNSDKGTFFSFNDNQYDTQSLKSGLNLSFLFESAELYIESVSISDTQIDLYCKSNRASATCPYCQTESHKVHSRYSRCIVDLPILGRMCVLHIEVRKFFCGNKHCGHKTFGEQPGNEIFRYRRRTRRCELQILRTSITCSSNKASVLLTYSGIPVCNTTILRDLHRTQMADHTNVRRIGIDDWAFRKGVDYGSIIIDMDTGHVIDLLGDREHDSFKSWLDGHQDVCLVSRDRSTEYSAAIASTGRRICEVADLFHLVKNMSECVTKIISDNYHSYRETVIKGMESEEEVSASTQEISVEPQIKEDSRMAIFREVKRLQALGRKPAWICRHLKIAHQTATKYCAMDILPKRKSKCRNEYYKYDSYVESEYAKGKSLSDIRKEIVSMGFKGSLTPFYDHYHYLSDGHRGHRSKKQKKEMVKKAKSVVKAYPILPIRQLSTIVDRKIRETPPDTEKDSEIICKLSGLSWFKEMFLAA